MKSNLTPFTPCPLFPLSKMERGLGGEAEGWNLEFGIWNLEFGI